ncbi:MAG TPA: 16S rRNA (guanine(527)-N(7))-methyltransferase RsmG [Nitrospirota bacterium]|nr:16S rRNA (guanine(527)-N(7))-methyltransferase RsmG [Nitrospirota bacterium]
MTPREILKTGAQELGIALTVERINSLFIYLAELKKWNRQINLTAITEERDMVIKHVLDSLSYLKGFTPAPGLLLLDMGSGAGFPALPLKIAFPEIAVTLVESAKKKASFLRHVMRTLKLTGAEIIDKRTEELPVSLSAFFDVVTARAFADMEKALSVGVPFLKEGGLMVLSRGPEEAITEPEIAKAGVTLKKRIEQTLPHSDYKRAIWVFKKTS